MGSLHDTYGGYNGQMPRFLIIIANRELIIDAPSLIDAQETAMNEYPGETVTGFAQMSTADETGAGESENDE